MKQVRRPKILTPSRTQPPFSFRRNNKSARTPYILMSGSRGSKRNIDNVLAGYLTNCYKLRRAFSRPVKSAAFYIPPHCPLPTRVQGLALVSVDRTNDGYSGDHMVFPYVHTGRDGTHPNSDRCPSVRRGGEATTTSGR